MSTGLVSSLQGYSIKDGPGIRTTVFLVGCSLACRWCSNPELITPFEKDLQFHRGEEKILTHVGTRMTPAELCGKLRRDKVFYEESGGGVTFSGGEPLLQAEFVRETAEILSGEGISVAVDTAGNVPEAAFASVLPYTDLFLYDLKAMDADLHRACTGSDNQRILSNLRWLAEHGARLWIRMVIVPGENDALTDAERRMQFIRELGPAVERTEILPYHTLGAGKYTALGIACPIHQKDGLSDSCRKSLHALADRIGLEIRIEGEEAD